MATLDISGYKRIITDRKFEDYKSMKKYFSAYYSNGTKEIIFLGHQLATAGAGVIIDGSDFTIGAQIAAEGVAFLSTLADDSNQDLKSVWIIYQDDTGLIHGPIEHLLNDDADTTVEAALGNEDVNDTVASGQGTTAVTLTALAGTLNQYAGMYMVVQSGNEVGDVHLIVSNTAATPTVLTVVGNTGAALDADIIQIQQFPCNDFFRMREMYCEVEPLDDKTIRLGNFDSSVIYGGIGEGARYMANSGFFTQPSATCRSFLGKIKASHSLDSTVTELVGASVFVTFTPLEAYSNGGSADITIELTFSDFIEWEPCIELEPATDVIVKISNVEGAKLDNMFVEVTYLEVYK